MEFAGRLVSTRRGTLLVAALVALLAGASILVYLNSYRESLKSQGAVVTGPAAESARIPTLDRTVAEGDTVMLGAHEATVIETPGHTLGHVVFHFAAGGLLFSGDTLFAMGCGRLFEGTAEQMFGNMQRLAELPGDTSVCCGHEYTQSNGRYALTVEPENAALTTRMAEVDTLRARRGEGALHRGLLPRGEHARDVGHGVAYRRRRALPEGRGREEDGESSSERRGSGNRSTRRLPHVHPRPSPQPCAPKHRSSFRRIALPRSASGCRWARLDSNQGATDYESAALTAELRARPLRG